MKQNVWYNYNRLKKHAQEKSRMYTLHVSVVCMETGRRSLLVGLERRGFLWSSAVLRFRLPLSTGRRHGKKTEEEEEKEEKGGGGGGGRKRKKQKQEAPSSIFLPSHFSFLLHSACYHFPESSKGCSRHCGLCVGLHSVGRRMECVPGALTSPSVDF